MQFNLKCLLFFLLLAWRGTVLGQGIFHETINRQSGLISEQVYAVFKDSKGYIWCTTDEGLFRYNGKQFTAFKSNSNLSLTGSNIKEDAFGRIWYQTFDGYFLYVSGDKLKALPFVQTSGFKPYVLTATHLYFVTDNGIARTDLKTLKTSILIAGKGFEYCHLLGDYLYFGDSAIYKYHLTSRKKQLVYSIHARFNSLITFVVNNQLLIADRIHSQTPIYILDHSGLIKRYPLRFNQTIQNVYFQNGNYWFFTPIGIYCLDEHFKPATVPRILENQNVSSVTQDLDGNFWIGSPSSGIFIIKDLKSLEYSLPDDQFSAISQKNGTIFTGTKTGQILEHDHNLIPHVYYDTKTNHHILFMDFRSFPNWNFFTGNGLTMINTQTKQLLHNPASVKQISKINDQTVAFAATGFSGYSTIGQLSSDRISEYNCIREIRAKSCTYDSLEKCIYIASNKGLICLKKQKYQYIKHLNKPILTKALLYFNRDLYGITNNGTLFRIRKNQYREVETALRFKTIKRFHDRIYLSTNDEIYSFHNDRLTKLKTLNKSNFIIDFEIIGRKLFILSPQKLIQLSLSHEKQSNEKPHVYIQTVNFNGKPLPVSKWKNVPFHSNSITIVPEIVNFNFHEDYRFYYQINGKIYPISESNPTITLAELSPGDYAITVFAKQKNSPQIISQTRLPLITILPPFWKQYWFLALIAIGIIAGLYTLYRARLKHVEHRNEIKLNQLELENNLKESRLQLIKSQMNPHFFFNSLNNIQSYIFTNETKEASLYLSKLSRLTRKILEFSDVNSISITEEIESLQLYLEIQKMRFSDLDFSITFDGNVNPDNVQIPTMLFQPYVENSILHGLSHSTKSKVLTIHFQLLSPKILNVIIEDNGIGRRKSQEINDKNLAKNQSFATKANLARIQLLNKEHYNIHIAYTDLGDLNEESKGTRVTINIELK